MKLISQINYSSPINIPDYLAKEDFWKIEFYRASIEKREQENPTNLNPGDAYDLI